MAYASCEAYNFNIFSTWFIIISIIVFSLFSGISRGPCDNCDIILATLNMSIYDDDD